MHPAFEFDKVTRDGVGGDEVANKGVVVYFKGGDGRVGVDEEEGLEVASVLDTKETLETGDRGGN